MSFTKDCFSGVIHEGNPAGRIESINGVDTYIALPDGDYPKDKAVLLLTDVFGVALINNKLLADAFARNGFQVYMPDYFAGDPIPADGMNAPGFDRQEWTARHSPRENARPLLDRVLAGLKERGIIKVAATGYCYGARLAVDLAIENAVSAISIAHPSRIEVPDDLHKLIAQSRAPVQIQSCETDQAFPAAACAAADEILGGGKYTPGYERAWWKGCTHGFAVRGDLSNPLVKAGMEGAFKGAVEWFAAYL